MKIIGFCPCTIPYDNIASAPNKYITHVKRETPSDVCKWKISYACGKAVNGLATPPI